MLPVQQREPEPQTQAVQASLVQQPQVALRVLEQVVPKGQPPQVLVLMQALWVRIAVAQ
jgi:hypothetical protein